MVWLQHNIKHSMKILEKNNGTAVFKFSKDEQIKSELLSVTALNNGTNYLNYIPLVTITEDISEVLHMEVECNFSERSEYRLKCLY